jgi:hypothetical protein
MTRLELMELLTRAVRDGWMTEDEAAVILVRYDNGEWINEAMLPVPIDLAIVGDDTGTRRLAAATALLLLAYTLRRETGATRGKMQTAVQLIGVAVDEAEVLARITPYGFRDTDRAAAVLAVSKSTKALQDAEVAIGNVVTWEDMPAARLNIRANIADTLQDAFETDTRRYAQRLADGKATLSEWQSLMSYRIRRHIAEQTMAGKGTDLLSNADIQRLDSIMRRETAYLSRFADQLAVGQARGEALSSGHIANRAEMYGGTARGEFFRANEYYAVGGNANGWVCEYITRGDSNVCSPCEGAGERRWYLPGQGPLPGQVCLGRARCRCRRDLVFDPIQYARLMAGSV